MEEEEKIKLTEEQASEFIKNMCEGDIHGLEYLQNVLKNEVRPPKNDSGEDIFDIIDFIISLNSMVVYGEMFEGICADNHSQIYDLYDTMKTELFNLFDNDFDSLWEKYSC